MCCCRYGGQKLDYVADKNTAMDCKYCCSYKQKGVDCIYDKINFND